MDFRNPLFKELKEKGFVLLSLDDFNSIIDYRLTNEGRDNNRNLMNKLYNKSWLIEIIRDSFGKNISY